MRLRRPGSGLGSDGEAHIVAPRANVSALLDTKWAALELILASSVSVLALAKKTGYCEIGSLLAK